MMYGILEFWDNPRFGGLIEEKIKELRITPQTKIDVRLHFNTVGDRKHDVFIPIAGCIVFISLLVYYRQDSLMLAGGWLDGMTAMLPELWYIQHHGIETDLQLLLILSVINMSFAWAWRSATMSRYDGSISAIACILGLSMAIGVIEGWPYGLMVIVPLMLVYYLLLIPLGIFSVWYKRKIICLHNKIRIEELSAYDQLGLTWQLKLLRWKPTINELSPPLIEK